MLISEINLNCSKDAQSGKEGKKNISKARRLRTTLSLTVCLCQDFWQQINAKQRLTWISVELRGQPGVGVIDSLGAAQNKIKKKSNKNQPP